MSERPALNVVQLPVSDLRDVVDNLRRLADQIEAGTFGEIQTCGVALFSDKTRLFGYGNDSSAPTVALLFHAAAIMMAMPIVEHGE